MLLLTAACGPTYPKAKLLESVRKLFQKELKVEARAELLGKTLYASFPVQGLIRKDFQLPEEAVEQLNSAMLSVTRIAFSTDADIQFVVVEAKESVWGVRLVLIRRIADLKDLIYWRISRNDFDERLVLEMEKEAPPAGSVPHEITLEEFMGRLVASRITLGARANPFLGVLLGIHNVSSLYEPEARRLKLIVEPYAGFKSSGSISAGLLRDSIEEQMAAAEKKYLLSAGSAGPAPGSWAKEVAVEDTERRLLMKIERKEWLERTAPEAKKGLKIKLPRKAG